MSDLEVCPATSTGGIVLMENRLCTTASSFQSFPAVLNSISEQNWEIAERRTDEILCLIRPTLVSDNNRREVINYVHDLISASLGCEVFPYGSVPLKTYLPDGDIDLTAISSPNVEATLVADVHAVLKAEELNMCSQFEVKDVHCIDAEVKLVKCLVQNIVVDISFNQLGGLCALCFLEQVDGLVGKNHLLKRSIILIKAWCYYESRILGAHHGLISTYALETLVLSIFHLFHSSLDGPLAVLYRFLDYFSKFDWENHCVSLNGPVCKSSLDVAASKVPERGVDNLLLSEEFLQEYADKFSVPSRGPETNSRAFPQKHLNIIDALKENNNLGRSVNRGNFYRICSAFKYGAHKLGQILLLPQERLVTELNKFFANTLERHRNQYWADGQDFFSNDDNLFSTQCSETCIENMFLTSLTPGYSNEITRSRNDSRGDLLKVVPSAYKKKVDSSKVVPELNCTSDRNTVSGRHLAEAARGGPIGILYSKNRNDLSSSLPLNSGIGVSLLGKSQIDNGSLPGRILSKSFQIDDMSFALCSESKENTSLTSSSFCLYGNHESIVPKYLSLLTPVSNVSANSSSPPREKKLTSILGSSERSNCLLDLSGNYESYLSSLLYGKCYYLSAAVLLCPGNSHQVQHKNLQETIWQSLPLEPEVYSKMSRNGRLGHQNHPSMPSNFVFSSGEKKKSGGIGTYFPNVNYLSNRDRLFSRRERFQPRGSHGQLQRYRNGLVSDPMNMNLGGESQEEFPVLGNVKAKLSDSYQPHPSAWGASNANNFSHTIERPESGSHGRQLNVTPPKVRMQPDSDTSYCDSPSTLVVPKSQGPNLSIKSSQDRDREQSYHLKNEVDFPPLPLRRMVKISNRLSITLAANN